MQCERRFVNLEKVSEKGRSGKGRNSVEFRRTVSNPEGGSGNSRPKAPQPDGGTPERRIKKECNREQKRDVVTR